MPSRDELLRNAEAADNAATKDELGKLRARLAAAERALRWALPFLEGYDHVGTGSNPPASVMREYDERLERIRMACGVQRLYPEMKLHERSEFIATLSPAGGGGWPEGISDGLTLACSDCGQVPRFDYHVTDEFWKLHVPEKPARLSVVCLPCLDRRCGGVGLIDAIEQVQWTGTGHTVVLWPTFRHAYEPRRPATLEGVGVAINPKPPLTPDQLRTIIGADDCHNYEPGEEEPCNLVHDGEPCHCLELANTIYDALKIRAGGVTIVPAVKMLDITTITDALLERSGKFKTFFSRAELEEHVALVMAPLYSRLSPAGEGADIIDLRKQVEQLNALALTLNRRLVLTETAFHTAHGALLCIAGSDDRWKKYATKVADDAAELTAGELSPAGEGVGATRSWDDQKLIEALEERIGEYKSGVEQWAGLYHDVIDLVEEARPFITSEAGQTLSGIDAHLKARAADPARTPSPPKPQEGRPHD